MDKMNIYTSLFEPGQELAVMRWPLLHGKLMSSNIGYGVVAGKSDSPSEVVLGGHAATVCSCDSDGDAVILCPDKDIVELGRRIYEQGTEALGKNHTRKKSSMFELNDVIIDNLFSASVGTGTMSMVACHHADQFA